MMDIYEEIRKNSGLQDVEYLEEGIVFFKNSNKIKRLSKKLIQKHVELIRKGKSSEASAINVLINEIDKIGNKFEKVEQDFRNARGKENKNSVKQNYEKLELDFKKLINIANKESMKKILIATGTAALVVGVLAAGAFGFISLKNSGVFDSIASNLDARNQLRDLNIQTAPAETDSKLDTIQKSATRMVSGVILSNIIQSTNKDLVAVASVAGATAGGVLSVGVISELRSMAQKDKTIASTLRAIEDIKAAEKRNNVSSDSEGDEIDDK